MVRIRLRRVGLRHQTSYRIVVADKESPRDGRFLEIVGTYNPRTNPSELTVKEDRVYEWLRQGAQPSESVVKIFETVKLMDRYKRFEAAGFDAATLETLTAEAKIALENVPAKPKKAKKEKKKKSR